MNEYSKDPPFENHIQSFYLFQVPLKTSYEKWALRVHNPVCCTHKEK